MEDDIDIEEHDVLDNPRIRTIFPDLTQIKKEIPDDYHDQDSLMEYQPYSKSEDSRRHDQEDTSEYARFGNKIILGSKPSSTLRISEDVQNGESVLVFGRKSIVIKQEAEEYEETTEEVHHPEDVHEETYNSASSVLILGSKPSSSGVIEPLTNNDVSRYKNELAKSKTKFFNQEIDLNCEDNDSDHDLDNYDPKDPTAALVLLENWGPRLQNSSCYCKECLILFPTSNTLLAHNMTAHSFLVAVDKNKAVKSTAKPTVQKVSNDSGKFCNHCNKIFPDSDSLINHLYEKLTFDKNNAVFKPQKVVPNPSKTVLPKQLQEDAEFGSEMQVYDQEAVNFYQCPVCSIYLELHGCFIRHMSNNHSKTEFSQEKVLFNGICLLCNIPVKNKRYYNKHIKLLHPEVYIYKGPLPQAQVAKKLVARKQPIPKVVPQTQIQKFQCQKCNAMLTNKYQVRRHRQTKHPESKSQNIFKKITNFKNKTICVQKARVPSKVGLMYSKNLQKGKVETRPEIIPNTSKSPQKLDTSDSIEKPRNQVVVPQSVLFKCNKCPTHFTSCTATVLHVKVCGKQKGDWKCNICHRDFQIFDQNVHKRQHQISKNFYVIPYYEYIYGRVLNQCPNCELYFHEKDFYLHDQKSFCRGGGVKCDQCAFPIHTSSVDAHAKWHERIDINKKNVIVVEFGYVVSENNTLLPAKRELEFSEQGTPAKKVRKKELTTVHYCQTCGLFMFRGGSGHALNHVTGKCKNLPKKKQLCKICGLTYASFSHTVFHKEHPEVTLMDMKFVSIKEKEAIAPPIPVFPSCNKCKVHFCKQDTVLTHNCNDSYKTCKHCQKRFSDLAFKLHVRFHDYIAKFKASKSIDLKKPKAKTNPEYLASPRTSKMMDPLPELLKNYEKLTDSWNILFSCETCDIVCDSYDRAVEHCQNHFNNMESYDIIIQNCERCDLKFDGSCYEKHAELHAQNKKITKDSFTIVKYRYTTLLGPTWFFRFKRLPDTQLKQILSRSIYRHVRSVKLRVVRQGAPEITIYRCGKCETFVHPYIVSSHYKSVACNKNTTKYDCRYCGVLYNSAKARNHHQELHKMGKAFTVVYFNEDVDDEFNKKLRENDQVHDNHIVGIKNSNGQSKVYRFYMCMKCKCCCSTALRRKYHRCSDANKIERCKICHLYFNVSILTRHTKFHELNPKLSKKNIKCVPFRPQTSDAGLEIEYKANEEMPTVKLYKCQCGLHFTSTNAAEKHFKSCGEDSDTAKEKCSKCKRLFDTTQLVTHLCKHHSKDEKNPKFEIINVTPGDKSKTQDHTVDKSAPRISDKRKTLYKCRRCDVCYLSASGLAYHFETNHQVSKIRPCPHCQLKFMPMTLKKHITLQHQLIQCKAKDFIIRTGVNKDGLLKILDIESKPVNKASKKIIDIKKVKKANPKSDPSLIKPGLRNLNLAAYNNTLYKCKVCRAHFLTKLALKSHMFINKSIKGHRSELVNCPDCHFTFKKVSLIRHRYVHHETMKLQREDFKIKCKDYLYESDNESDVEKSDNKSEVENSSQDSAENSQCSVETSGKFSESDNAILAVDTISYKTDKTDDLATSQDKNKQSKIFLYTSILYKCGVCNTIFQTSQGIEVHLKEHPVENQELVPCFCGLNFSRASLVKHTMLHHDKQNLSKDDLYILTMGLYDKYAAGNYLFRCETCQVCFSKLKILENHLSTIEHFVQKSTCPHCGLIILTRSLPWHLKVQHGFMKLKREEFVVLESFGKNKLRLLEPLAKEETNSSEDLTQYKATLHKCGSCGTHYINASDLNLHQAICRQDTYDTVFCEECQLKFSKNGLETHVETHHKNKQLKLDDFQIIEYGDDGNIAKDDDSEDLIAKESEENCNEAFTSAMSTENEDSLVDKDDDTSESKIIYANENKLYQCGKCKNCFNSNRNIKQHYAECESIQPNKKCDHCQLMFLTKKSLNTHINRHHRSVNFKFYVILVNYDEKSALSQVVKTVSSKKPLEITENVSTLDKELYTNQLFKCNTCFIHFLLEESLEMHTKYPEVKIPKSTCTCCGLIFSVNTLPTHVFIHHEKMKLNAEHFDVTSKKEYMDDDRNRLDSVNAYSEEMALTSKDTHSSEDAHVTDTICIDDTESDDENKTVIKKDADVVSKVTPADSLDKKVEDESQNSKDVTNSSRIDPKESDTGITIKLYKCAVCNVCFLSQTSCYKHVTKHITLDPKDYIECKLCGYQFLILNNSLHRHVTKHHRSNFKPEDVLIEEYNPHVLCHGSPKIDIYFGTDKVQSKLISTTSDTNVSSCSEDSDKNVKTSNNVTIDLDSSVDSLIEK